MPAASPMFMPLRPTSKGRQGFGSTRRSALNPLKVTRHRTSAAAADGGVERPVGDGVRGVADGDGARRAGRHGAGADAQESEPRADGVNRRAREVVEDLRRPAHAACRAVRTSARYSSLRSRSPVPEPSMTPIRVGSMPLSRTPGSCSASSAARMREPIATRQAASFQRGEVLVRWLDDLGGCAAAIAGAVEQRYLADAAAAFDKAVPDALAADAERAQRADAGNRDAAFRHGQSRARHSRARAVARGSRFLVLGWQSRRERPTIALHAALLAKLLTDGDEPGDELDGQRRERKTPGPGAGAAG